MSYTEPKIVGVAATGAIEDIGAEAAKRLPPGSRARYYQALTYTLEDGRTCEGQARGTTKPKLRESIERSTRYAAEGMLFASLSEAGQFRGTIMRMSLNIGRQ